MNYIRINGNETNLVLLYFFQTADILTKTFIKSNTIQHNRIKQVYEQISIQIYITLKFYFNFLPFLPMDLIISLMKGRAIFSKAAITPFPT